MGKQVLVRKNSPSSVRMARGKALEREVQQAYESAGWTVIASAGMPDLFCVRIVNGERQIKFVECKAGSSNLRPKQKNAIKKMRKMQVEVDIAREVPTFQVSAPTEVRAYLPITGSSFRLSAPS